MEFKAKIKSMTQHPIRGTRLFPNQIITADNPKSDHIVPLTDSVHSQLPNSRHLTLQDPSI